MNEIIIKLQNPKIRRQMLMIASGTLILLALGAGKNLGAQSWRDELMVVAAVIAGWDIAVRAFTSLRNRHISIELLVTIAILLSGASHIILINYETNYLSRKTSFLCERGLLRWDFLTVA